MSRVYISPTGSICLETDQLTVSIPVYIRFSESLRRELLRKLSCKQITITGGRPQSGVTTYVQDQSISAEKVASLSAKLGASPSFFADLVRGSRSVRLETALTLCRALGVELLTRSELELLIDKVRRLAEGLDRSDNQISTPSKEAN